MQNKRKRLGKGLSALIKSDEKDFDYKKLENKDNLLSIDKISIGQFQARRKFDNEALNQLADSIKKIGLIQPIIIRKKKNNSYELVAGERRLKACKMANINEIPVIVSNLDDRKAFESGLIENLQREDLTSIEEAEGYYRLMNEFNYTQEQLANVISKSRSHIGHLLRLISLPQKVKQYILDKKLSLGHAKCLVGYDNSIQLAGRIIKEGLSVRYVEGLLGGDFNKKDINFKLTETEKKIKTKDADTSLLEKELSLKLGVKLTISDKNNKGNIKIEYRTISQREKIIQKLKN